MLKLGRLCAGVLGAALLTGSALAGEALPCPSVHVVPLALTHLKQAIAENHEVTIVALGSSSTEGVRASDLGHSYPAVLQTQLQQALPNAHWAVLNRGIGGQDVPEELPRIDTDALAVKPTLVIWQVGANGAMQHVDPQVFEDQVRVGLRKFEEAGVDVVLMDNQRSPMVMASPEHTSIEQAMTDLSKSERIGLFSRSRLMDAWQAAGYPYADFLSNDGVHHNDRGYACVAQALAQSIVAGLAPAAPIQMALKTNVRVR